MKCLLAIAALVASCSLSALARADAPPPAMDCRPVQQELAEAQRRLEEREAACTALEGERARCASDLERSRQREEDRAHDAEVCSAAKERLCGGVGRLAASIADGSVDAGGANACVPQEARARIQARLDGAANTTHALAQLTAYALGETDALPQLGTGKGTPAERSLARIVGRGAGPTRLYRRLLVEAIREAAPQASRDIMRLGPADLDGVFRRGRALDARLQDEVERRASDRGADGASLVRALNLVHAFRILACHDRPAPEACAFAESFAELLESRGDFVVRRRVEEIWETPCASIGVEAVAAWLSDLPAASDVDAADDRELVEAVADKAFVCFLDAATDVTFSDWLRARTPKDAGSAAARARLDALGDRTIDADENACAAAVRALQQLPTPTSCGIDGARRAALAAYVGVGRRAHEPGAPNGLRACDSLVRHLFAGEAATIPPTFEGGPPAHGWVRVDATKPPTRMARVRAACAERRGPEASFDDDVVALAEIAAGLGEVPSAAPWHVVDAGTGADARGTTIEEARFAENRGFSSFAADVLARRSACAALAMRPERCLACSGLPRGEYQDCAVLARLERVRRRFMIESIGASVLAALAALSLVWAGRYRRARRALGSFVTDTVGHLERMGMRARPTRPAWLAPSSMGQIQATLPATAAWERWGDRAVLVRGGMGRRVSEHDVHRAGTVARAEGACVAILVHDDGANPDLGAVRAMLDWAARGSAKAVQILPLSLERLRWSTSADDLLDLVEEASVGGNPFEVRERITSSAQFFARERLVSGLLASAQAGRWVVVT
ncbi:MAG TPA: hypothetical protein VHB21_25230, partial [Minicystis sp.]|nr:hypothetical protein [Minicystis sp.]